MCIYSEKQDATEKLSTLVSRLSVLTIILIKLKQSSSLFCWFRHNAGVPISDTVVFSKVLILNNSPIVEKVSELNQISSELILTSSELILTIAEQIFTMPASKLKLTANWWQTGLWYLIIFYLLSTQVVNILSKDAGKVSNIYQYRHT